MSAYFRSPTPFIGAFVFPTAILGGGGIELLASGGVKGITGGLVMLFALASCYWWAISLLTKPAIKIGDGEIEVRGILGQIRKIDDVRTYRLVMDLTWVGFRRSGEQDVMISKGAFTKKTWSSLEDHLRQLPFAETK